MPESEPIGHPTGAAWAWIVAEGTGLWVFGAAQGSPANAWALGVASSEANSLEQPRSIEKVRDSGRITLVRASLDLFEAWKTMRSRLKGRLFEGGAVTILEHDRLLRRVAGPTPAPASVPAARMN